jgi:hypothetical protein
VTDKVQIQRSTDGGTTWETIRTTAAGLVDDDEGNVYDTEVGNTIAAVYRARGIAVVGATLVYGAWTTATPVVYWTSTSWWFKSVLNPGYDMPVAIDSQPSQQRAARQGVFQPLGSTTVVIVSDTPGPWTGTFRIRLDPDEQEMLDELLELRQPVLVQAPSGQGWADRFVMFGDQDRARAADKAFIEWGFDTLPWTEVAEPSGDIVDWPIPGS